MGDIILVKHADPAIIAQDPPSTWSLSPMGRRRCRELAGRLAPYEPSRIVCSDEPKAVQTAEVVGSRLAKPVSVDAGLRENDRSRVPFYERKSDFTRRVEEFFRRPSDLVLGLETADQAHARFIEAVRRISARESGGPVVVVSHGAVVSLLVARANDLDVASFWSDFGFTSYAVVTPGTFVLKEVVHADGRIPGEPPP